jgi:hypothetical protein
MEVSSAGSWTASLTFYTSEADSPPLPLGSARSGRSGPGRQARAGFETICGRTGPCEFFSFF